MSSPLKNRVDKLSRGINDEKQEITVIRLLIVKKEGELRKESINERTIIVKARRV